MRNPIKLLQKLLATKKETFELVDNLRENSDLSNDQTNMLGNLLQLGNVQISDVMVPRADIVSIEINKNFEETLKLFIEAAHSRLPVYKDQLDNIVGMIHVKDLLPYWNKNIESSHTSNYLINPLPNLFITGENYSLTQSWVEGALDTSDKCIDKIIKQL